jgi:hypothetical protein
VEAKQIEQKFADALHSFAPDNEKTLPGGLPAPPVRLLDEDLSGFSLRTCMDNLAVR